MATVTLRTKTGTESYTVSGNVDRTLMRSDNNKRVMKIYIKESATTWRQVGTEPFAVGASYTDRWNG